MCYSTAFGVSPSEIALEKMSCNCQSYEIFALEFIMANQVLVVIEIHFFPHENLYKPVHKHLYFYVLGCKTLQSAH